MLSILRLPDRLLHQRRHRAACVRLSRMSRPRIILVVCSGNICRSPYLEAVLRQALPDVKVISAGFSTVGVPVPEFSLAAGAERGVDLSEHRSRQFLPPLARDADLIIVMDPSQERYLARYGGVLQGKIIVAGDLDPEPMPTRAIADPFQQSRAAFDETFDRLDRCAETLLRCMPHEHARAFG